MVEQQWRPSFPQVASAAERQHGLPAGSIVQALFPQGWPWDEPPAPPAVEKAKAIWASYHRLWLLLDSPADRAERAQVQRQLAAAEVRWRAVKAVHQGVRVPPGQRTTELRWRSWLGDRLAALYALLAPKMPAQRRRGLDDSSRHAPRNFKHDPAGVTALLGALAYRECSPYLPRAVLKRDITIATVKNFLGKRPPAR